MKKWTILSILVMIFLLSANVGAIEQYEDMITTPEIENNIQKGEGEYLVQPLEWFEGTRIEDSLENYGYFEFGIAENTEIFSDNIFIADYRKTFDLNIKNKFYDEDGLKIAAIGTYAYSMKSDGSGYKTPSTAILTEKNFNDDLKLHNNIRLYFYESGNIGKWAESGFTYNFNDHNGLKASITPFTYNRFQDMEYRLRVGMESEFNEDITYFSYIYTEFNDPDYDNLHLNNIVEFKPIDSMTLTGEFTLNLGNSDNNWVFLEGEKEFGDLKLTGEYIKELVENGSYYINGISEYYIQEDYYIKSDFHYDVKEDYSMIRIGAGFDI